MSKTLADRIVLVVDYFNTPLNCHEYSLYVDGNLELESIEEYIDNRVLTQFGITKEEQINVRSILIEDANECFVHEAFTMMPEDSTDLFNKLGKYATKVARGVWHLQMESA